MQSHSTTEAWLMRRRLCLGLALLAFAPAGLSAKAGEPLRAQALPSAPALDWEDAQFVRADRNGDVYFLRGPKLEVYPVTKSGHIGVASRMVASGPMPKFVLEAAMDASGKSWLLLADGQVRLFGEDREKDLPRLDDQPWSVGFVGDEPIVALVPRPLEGRKGSPPWLVQAGRDRWNALVDFSAAYPGDPIERGRRNEIIGNSAVFLMGDRQGRLWAARRYAYRIERFTLGGKRTLHIQVGEGKVRHREKDEPVVVDVPSGDAQGAPSGGEAPARKATFRPFSGHPVVLDLAEARTGNLYFLVRTEAGGLAIDRYDPAADLLERRELGLSAEGRMTLAAGKDALYIAGWNGKAGRWRIAWEQLDEATGWSELAR